MAIYAIGDIQGCFESFEALLDKIGFAPSRDRLLLVGDLVNRGPASLDVLRWVRAHDDSVTTVLGNHDLHLLGSAAGLRKPGRRDTLAEVLAAPDRDELLAWLRRRPLLHQEEHYVVVHAGLAPAWSLSQARDLAAEAEDALQHKDGRRLLAGLVGETPRWSGKLSGQARLSAIAAGLTRIRMCDTRGWLEESYKGSPAEAPDTLAPWFQLRPPEPETTVVFGHWAALGFHRSPGYLGLDSGCVWGAHLTAVCLDDGTVVEQPALEQRG